MYDQQPTYRGPTDQLSPADFPVLQFQQNLATTVTVALVDPRLDEIPLTGSTSGSAASSVGSSLDADQVVIDVAPGEVEGGCVLVWREYSSSPRYTRVDGTRISAHQFQFQIPATALCRPGLFIGDLMILQDMSDLQTPMFVRRLYVEIEQNNSDTTCSNYPLTISEIRLALRDQDPSTNYLLEDVEFTDKEIEYALRKPVDIWNELPPPVAQATYANFRYRSHWTDCAIGILLQLAGRAKLRNHLPYTAGGVAVDDTGKWRDYVELGAKMIAEYKEWVVAKKVSINSGAMGWIN